MKSRTKPSEENGTIYSTLRNFISEYSGSALLMRDISEQQRKAVQALQNSDFSNDDLYAYVRAFYKVLHEYPIDANNLLVTVAFTSMMIYIQSIVVQQRAVGHRSDNSSDNLDTMDEYDGFEDDEALNLQTRAKHFGNASSASHSVDSRGDFENIKRNMGNPLGNLVRDGGYLRDDIIVNVMTLDPKTLEKVSYLGPAFKQLSEVSLSIKNDIIKVTKTLEEKGQISTNDADLLLEGSFEPLKEVVKKLIVQSATSCNDFFRTMHSNNNNGRDNDDGSGAAPILTTSTRHLNECKRELETTRLELQNLQASYNQVRLLNADKDNTIRNSAIEITGLTNVVQNSALNLKNQQTMYEAKITEVTNLTRELVNTKEENERIRLEDKKNKMSIQVQSSELTMALTEINRLKAMLQKHETQMLHQGSQGYLSASTQHSDTELQQIKRDNNHLREQTEKYNAEISNLKVHIIELENKITIKRSDFAKLENSLRESRSELETLNHTSSRQILQIDNLQSESKQLKIKLSESNEEIYSQKKEFERTISAANEKYNKELRKASSEIDIIKIEKETFVEQSQELNKKLKTLGVQLTQLQIEHGKSKHHLEEERELNNEARARLSKLEKFRYGDREIIRMLEVITSMRKLNTNSHETHEKVIYELLGSIPALLGTSHFSGVNELREIVESHVSLDSVVQVLKSFVVLKISPDEFQQLAIKFQDWITVLRPLRINYNEDLTTIKFRVVQIETALKLFVSISEYGQNYVLEGTLLTSVTHLASHRDIIPYDKDPFRILDQVLEFEKNSDAYSQENKVYRQNEKECLNELTSLRAATNVINNQLRDTELKLSTKSTELTQTLQNNDRLSNQNLSLKKLLSNEQKRVIELESLVRKYTERKEEIAIPSSEDREAEAEENQQWKGNLYNLEEPAAKILDFEQIENDDEKGAKVKDQQRRKFERNLQHRMQSRITDKQTIQKELENSPHASMETWNTIQKSRRKSKNNKKTSSKDTRDLEVEEEESEEDTAEEEDEEFSDKMQHKSSLLTPFVDEYAMENYTSPDTGGYELKTSRKTQRKRKAVGPYSKQTKKRNIVTPMPRELLPNPPH